MTIVWWILWAIELFVALALLWLTWRLCGLRNAATDAVAERDALRPQLQFWHARANVLDERLRRYSRKRDAKGRFAHPCQASEVVLAAYNPSEMKDARRQG